MSIDVDTVVSYRIGFSEAQRSSAAELYDAAFGRKLSAAIGSRACRLALFEATLAPDFSVSASIGSALVGVAGFHTAQGSLTGGLDARTLIGRLGLFHGLRALFVLTLFDRKTRPGELLMDGIAVDTAHRGRGIGGALLTRLMDHAREHGYGKVRLDVIDTNPDARRLYERFGFDAVESESFPVLRHLLGFGGSTTMVCRVDPEPDRLIRLATRDDVPAMQRVRRSVKENRLTSRTISDEEVFHAIERTGRGWVVEVGSQIVGFAIANGQTGNVWALFVDPEHERRGHGRRLHDEMIGWLRSQGLDRLWLTTERGSRAERFYEAAGWIRRKVLPDGEVLFEMERLNR